MELTALTMRPALAVRPPAAAHLLAAPITLEVDATNTAQWTFQVHETIPVTPGPLRLLYPQWLPGHRGPCGDSGQIDAHRRLVQQADRLFASCPWRHCDLLPANLKGDPFTALAHHASSENVYDGRDFEDWAAAARRRDDVAHEFVHAWNGRYRRPADLWSPAFSAGPTPGDKIMAVNVKAYEPERLEDALVANKPGGRPSSCAPDDGAATGAVPGSGAHQCHAAERWRHRACSLDERAIGSH